ncbi:fungal-specific transcription factor domain-containing protein [Scheffersomyces amazonensis]|uniref:fungal-specific transcription factor domain-containing protein n=1 Tax=Scheffersomyces amazonensis TaxID=1078765 RepID=UPI00315DB4DF
MLDKKDDMRPNGSQLSPRNGNRLSPQQQNLPHIGHQQQQQHQQHQQQQQQQIQQVGNQLPIPIPIPPPQQLTLHHHPPPPGPPHIHHSPPMFQHHQHQMPLQPLPPGLPQMMPVHMIPPRQSVENIMNEGIPRYSYHSGSETSAPSTVDAKSSTDMYHQDSAISSNNEVNTTNNGIGNNNIHSNNSSSNLNGNGNGNGNDNGNGANNKNANFKDDDTTDAMGAGSASGRKKDKGFYGRSAAISFMKELSSVVDENTREDEENESERSYRYTMSRNDKSATTRKADIVVPPRSVADKYVNNYFEYAYTLYPFVHRPTFMKGYEEIWSSESGTNEVDELFYSILNIIFAFGCRLTPEGEQHESTSNADLYFERSQELLRFHLMDTGSVLLVQALLLTGQFLQATTRSAGCWNILGLSIRIAQGLGLHSDLNLIQTKSYIEKEIRKRLWHGCLLMDRIVSMTLGRPLMVTDDHKSELPATVDDEYITDEAILYSPVGQPSVLSFFSETVKLYDILSEILQTFYNDEPDYVDLFLHIFKFEEKLSRFHENIPDHIKYGIEMKEKPYERQSIVLHIRYLHLKIMLYRPALFPKKRGRTNSSELYSSAQKSVSLVCVETAIELINLINKFRSRDIFLLPAHWYNVFYIYTAETVLLAAKLQPTLPNEINVDVFTTTWSMGLDILASYKLQTDSAARCLKVLEMMGEKVNLAGRKIARNHFDPVQSAASSSTSSSPSQVPTDVLYSLLYDTAGPFGGPFFYRDDMERYLN